MDIILTQYYLSAPVKSHFGPSLMDDRPRLVAKYAPLVQKTYHHNTQLINRGDERFRSDLTNMIRRFVYMLLCRGRGSGLLE